MEARNRRAGVRGGHEDHCVGQVIVTSHELSLSLAAVGRDRQYTPEESTERSRRHRENSLLLLPLPLPLPLPDESTAEGAEECSVFRVQGSGFLSREESHQPSARGRHCARRSGTCQCLGWHGSPARREPVRTFARRPSNRCQPIERRVGREPSAISDQPSARGCHGARRAGGVPSGATGSLPASASSRRAPETTPPRLAAGRESLSCLQGSHRAYRVWL